MPKRGHQPRGLLPSDRGIFVVTVSATSAVQGATVTAFAQFATSGGSPVAESGLTVTWGKTGTGGTFNNATSSTNSVGVASVQLTVGQIVGTTYTVIANGTHGVTGTSEAITVTADTVPFSLTVTPTTASLAFGATQQLTATTKNAIGATLTVPAPIWGSSNESVATVGITGIVTGVSQGTASITAQGSGLTSNAVSVTVASDVTAASIVIAPSTLTIASGTSQMSAVVKNASGGVIAGAQPNAWQSSNTAAVTVSNTGLITFVAAGSSNITATTTTPALTSNTAVITASAGGGGSDTHPNEPAGYTQLCPVLTGDVLPPLAADYVPGSANEIGWIQAPSVAKVTDVASPVDSTNVLQINFPAGMTGGGAPGGAYTMSSTNPQNWPSNPKRLYQSYWYKLSPNFPVNLVANKGVYTNLGAAGNVVYTDWSSSADYKLVAGVPVFAPGEGTAYTAPIWPTVEVQGIVSVTGLGTVSQQMRQNVGTGDPLLWTQIVRGRWHHVETLYISNTAGANDGTVKLWFDGTLLIDYSNKVQWTAAGGADWDFTIWLPVYGGGGMVPTDAVNAYHRLKNFYVSGHA